jgi:hypothetical protein
LVEKKDSLHRVKENLTDESGLPVMEIVEVLDDDDNVICMCSKVSIEDVTKIQKLELFLRQRILPTESSMHSKLQALIHRFFERT